MLAADEADHKGLMAMKASANVVEWRMGTHDAAAAPPARPLLSVAAFSPAFFNDARTRWRANKVPHPTRGDEWIVVNAAGRPLANGTA